MRSLTAKLAVPAGAVALTLALAGCAGGNSTSNAGDQTLTVDTSFVVKTLDPGTVYEQTGNIAVHALYDTLVTYEGSDVTTLQPELAESWEQSSDGTTWTFTLRDDAVFSDGAAVTAEDAVFSLNRLKNLQGSASQTVQGLDFAAEGDDTVVVTSATPNPDVPVILAMPAASVLNSAEAKKLGATDAEDAATSDQIGTQLDTASLGSGPYVLKSYDPSTKIVLTANPKYWGEQPAYSRVVIQNVDVQNQKLTISKAKGDEIALDLSGPQAAELSDDLQVSGVADTSYFLSLNQDPAVSAVTSNPAFVKALRLTVDGEGLAKLFGEGATPAAGLVPPAFAGALDESENPVQDIDGAKKLLADAGLSDVKVALVYPAITYRGVDLGTIVTKVQQDAKKAGIEIELTPQPINVFLQSQSEGKNEINFSPNSLNYPASSSLVNNMAPGASTSLRTGWTLERAEQSAIDASNAVTAELTPEGRNEAMIEWQHVMNEVSPYIALANNAGIVVATSDLTGADYTPAGWTVDLAAIAGK
ncbi:ABC transporter substrate-binding protein [Agromyces mediolanus]|uniref:ABC transporter substrate-binding protein n=1 Tax=Agromyces mediolanus TaxID=41986 RepID=UPI001E60CDF1|nr:ABC transporter substrate-binding protein [Agromyces mediolanus]MCD1570439.1 ABC transporter substrate-binding protein [Agromyces mediolanus]